SRARVRRRFSVSPTRLTILKSRCAPISQRTWCAAKCDASTASNIYWWISRSIWTWRRSKTLSRRLWRRERRSERIDARDRARDSCSTEHETRTRLSRQVAKDSKFGSERIDGGQHGEIDS